MTLRRVVTVGKQTELQQLARQVGREIFAADDLGEAFDIVERTNPDLVLFDSRFSPTHICEFRNNCLGANKNPNIHIVVVGSDKNDGHYPAEFIEQGAYDYLETRRDYHEMKEIVKRIQDKDKTAASKKNTDEFFIDGFSASLSMVGRSKATINTLKMIKLVAATECNPILIVGETGTGKELAAEAIHTLRHPHEEFVAVNCAALTANLLESELFGHVKGSFTGADREKTGLLELAGTGTVFLDEISEMPTDLQAKLLRVLQEKTFRKVGSVKTIACEATIIASSNRNLRNEVRAGRFRRDLYYRLNIFPVAIAPLRAAERKKDVSLLAEYFLRTSNICPQKSGKITSITKLSIEALQQHDWPGNVRELRNVIERAILLETTDKIGLSSIIINPDDADRALLSRKTDKINEFSLAKAERELIARALKETNWQKTKAADLLGISRATLYAKVKQHNIEKSPSVPGKTSEETHNQISAPYSIESVTVA